MNLLIRSQMLYPIELRMHPNLIRAVTRRLVSGTGTVVGVSIPACTQEKPRRQDTHLCMDGKRCS
jgi:hypothetical protein